VTKRTTYILAALIAGAIITRFAGLGAKSLWLDEVMSVVRSRGSLIETIREAARHDAHPPLYYLLLHLTKPLPASDAAPRLISAITGLLLVYVTYLAARQLMNRTAGLLAAFLAVLSAFQIYYAQEARPYALMMLLAMVSFLLLLRLIRESHDSEGKDTGSRLPGWIGYTAAAVAMLYTHYYLAFALLTEGVFLLANRVCTGAPRDTCLPSPSNQFLRRWLASRIIAAIAFTPYFIVVLGRMSGLPEAPQQPRIELLAKLPQAFVQMLTGLDFELSAAAAILLSAVAFVPVLSGMVLLYRNRTAFIAVLAFVLVPAACVLLLPWRLQIFEAKHLAFVAPFLVLPVACVPSAALKRPLAWLGCTLILAANLLSLAGYYSAEFQKERWPEAVAIINKELQPGDVIVFNPYYAGLPFYHYSQDIIEPGKLAASLNVEQLSSTIRPHRRVWLVELSSNVAIPMPTHTQHISDNYTSATFTAGGETVEYAILPARNGTILVRVFEKPD